jgi:DNA-binding response OmpR family regulator
MQILAIDDNKDILRLLDIKLSALGHDVRTAQDGERGEQLLADQPPDALILETELSLRHGLDLIAQARSGPGPGPVIIVLSHQDSDEHIRSCLRAGADDVMTKPFSPTVLAERLRVAALRRG